MDAIGYLGHVEKKLNEPVIILHVWGFITRRVALFKITQLQFSITVATTIFH